MRKSIEYRTYYEKASVTYSSSYSSESIFLDCASSGVNIGNDFILLYWLNNAKRGIDKKSSLTFLFFQRKKLFKKVLINYARII